MKKTDINNVLAGISGKAAAAANSIKETVRRVKENRESLQKGTFEKSDSFVNKIEGKLGRKTTVLARIVRLTTIGVVGSSVILTAVNLISMYSNVRNSAADEMEMLTISYASAVSNADITGNHTFLDNLFKDFDESNTYGGFGFVITDVGGVISGTDSVIVEKGDNIVTLAETDSGYAEFAELIDTFDRTTGHKKINICGSDYFVGWSNVKNFDTCYTMILLPYSDVMRPFFITEVVSMIIAAALIAAALIVSSNVANHITKPIIDAIERLRMLADGDLETPSPLTGRNDETLVLLTALNDTISSLNAYINDIKAVLSGVAEGNLLVRSNAVYSGNFTEIKYALDRILKSLNGTFSEVHKAALSVKECSTHVSDGTAVLSRNTSEEASTMEKLTVSVADVSEKINENAAEAEKARNLTVSADKSAERGSANMRQMMVAIGDIETASAEIEKIINVIDDIAFQTNILALNAAVEAARAGDAGKGFAVVADEVRNLATKSSEAAAQTGVLIENSIKSVHRGIALANETAKSLDKVVETVSSVSEIIDRIAESAIEQAETVTQINMSMESINGSIQKNSVTAERNVSVSNELSGQFDMLSRLINKFSFK